MVTAGLLDALLRSLITTITDLHSKNSLRSRRDFQGHYIPNPYAVNEETRTALHSKTRLELARCTGEVAFLVLFPSFINLSDSIIAK